MTVLGAFTAATASAQLVIESGTIIATDGQGTPTLTLQSQSSHLVSASANKGDFGIVFDEDIPSPVRDGALITSVAETSRLIAGNDAFATSAADITFLSGGADDIDTLVYSIALSESPSGAEINIDTSFAWFPYSQWLGAFSINPPAPGTAGNNEATTSLITGEQSGVNQLVLGRDFRDDGNGLYTVDLTTLDPTATSANGILLASGGENSNEYAITESKNDGTFVIYNHQNTQDGNTHLRRRVSFVYLGKDDIGKGGLVAMGRVQNGGTAPVSGGDFTITKDTPGIWELEIPGHSPDTGNLLVTAATGETTDNGIDNFVSSRWDENEMRWVIESRDISSATTPPTLDDGTDGLADIFHFAFIAPTLEVANTNDNGPGSLRQAIIDAEDRNMITFAENLSGETITLTGGQFLIDKDLTISAVSLPAGLTIDAAGQSRIMEINRGHNVALHGLTLTGGLITGNGGAINNRANLSLSACTLFGNSAEFFGGGIYNDGAGGSATLSLEACTLSGNSALFGGGIMVNAIGSGSATLSLDACTLSGNFASGSNAAIGGGIFVGITNSSATLDFIDTILSGNTALTGSLTQINSNLFVNGSNPELTINTTGNNIIGDVRNFNLTAGPTVTINPDPKLSPLGHYGGPTQTMHPLAGSPAIISGANTTRMDQRGFTLTGPKTIGAVKVPTVMKVTNEASLRSALAASADTQGQVICFDSSLNGTTITLTGTQLEVPGSANGLFIDASDLLNGLTIDANQQSRVMENQPGATTALQGLTLTGGFASNSGGAIFNNRATLSLSACTLSGNSTELDGGGIFSNGGGAGRATLSLSACTLSGNSAGNLGGGIVSNGSNNGRATLSLSACTLSSNSAENDGGGILSVGNFGNVALSLSACTLSGNSAGGDGGGILSQSSLGSVTLSLSACTLSGNVADEGGGISSSVVSNLAGSAPLSLSNCTLSGNSARIGGGFQNNGSATLRLSNTILAGNTAQTGPDLAESSGAMTTAIARNLMSSIAGSNIDSENLPSEITISTDPLLLAPLGNYGGLTQTMVPLAGSPAIDRSGTTASTDTDQRGFPRLFGTGFDIGAVEFQGEAREFEITFDLDSDSDGSSNGVELAIGTDPLIADPCHIAKLRLTEFDDNGRPSFTFGLNNEEQNNIILFLTRFTNLEDFSFDIISNDSIFFADPGAGLLEFDDPNPPAGGKAFYRLEAVRR